MALISRTLTTLVLLLVLLPASTSFALNVTLGADGRIVEDGRPRSGLPGFVGLAVGEQHALAIDRRGWVWAWGGNSAGQLGTGSFRPQAKPIAVPELRKIVAVAAGRRHSVALAADGRVWAWGADQFGQTGTGNRDSFASQPSPGLVPLPVAIKAVAAGDHHTLALAADGSLWAWGAGDRGQLGAGGRLDQARPVKVKLKEPLGEIFARGSRSGALALAGHALSWGGEPRGKAGLLPGRVSLSAAWFRETLPQSPRGAPPALAAAPKATPAPANLSAPGALAKGAPPASAGHSPAAAAAPPAGAGPAVAAQPPARPAAGPAPQAPAPQAETVLIRGRILLPQVGSSRGLAGVEMRAGNTDCPPSDSEGWFECRVASGWSGALRPRKAKYRFAPSSVSLERVQADMDSQQYFTAIYEPF